MIKELKTKLNENKIPYLDTDKGIKIQGDTDFDIDIYDERFELIMFLGEAHYHCDNIEEILEILHYAMEGKLKIIIKLRGKTVVGSQIQIIDTEGNVRVLEQTGALISPFWKKKSFEEKYFKKMT